VYITSTGEGEGEGEGLGEGDGQGQGVGVGWDVWAIASTVNTKSINARPAATFKILFFMAPL